MKKNTKYIIAFDTICDGWQCAKDENENPNPALYDSYDEAFKEIFIDAKCGMNGSGEDEDEILLSKMEQLIKEDNIDKMKEFFEQYPDANYYNEFVVKYDEFLLGRKAIFTGKGVTIIGTKLI